MKEVDRCDGNVHNLRQEEICSRKVGKNLREIELIFLAKEQEFDESFR
jgi:hypothetical protein